jgi:cysteine synthase A
MSTGCNLIGAIEVLQELPSVTVATLICDDGARYSGKLDNESWLRQQGLDTTPWERALEFWHESGVWAPPIRACMGRAGSGIRPACTGS